MYRREWLTTRDLGLHMLGLRAVGIPFLPYAHGSPESTADKGHKMLAPTLRPNLPSAACNEAHERTWGLLVSRLPRQLQLHIRQFFLGRQCCLLARCLALG